MDAGTGQVEGTSKLYGEHSVCNVRWNLFVLPAHDFQITQPFMTGLSAQHSLVVCCAVDYLLGGKCLPDADVCAKLSQRINVSPSHSCIIRQMAVGVCSRKSRFT